MAVIHVPASLSASQRRLPAVLRLQLPLLPLLLLLLLLLGPLDAPCTSIGAAADAAAAAPAAAESERASPDSESSASTSGSGSAKVDEGAASTVAAPSRVVRLSGWDFRQTVGKETPVLVKFFAPWCGHCKRMAPEYEKLAVAFSTYSASVIMAEVNCEEEGELCRRHNVLVYPTLRWFAPKPAGSSHLYSGDRNFEDMHAFVRQRLGIDSPSRSLPEQPRENPTEHPNSESSATTCSGAADPSSPVATTLSPSFSSFSDQFPSEMPAPATSFSPSPSNPAQSTAGGYAVTLRRANLDTVVLDESKDVIVLFHEPGCERCDEFLEVFDDLAKAFRWEDGVVVATAEAGAVGGSNFLADRFGVRRFPRVRWFSKADKSGLREYAMKPRLSELNDLVHYVNKHAGTQRTATGMLSDKVGRIQKLDDLAKRVVSSDDGNHSGGNGERRIVGRKATKRVDAGVAAAAIARAKVLVNELPPHESEVGALYLKVFQSVVQEGKDYARKEYARLSKLLAGPLSHKKSDELAVKRNVVTAFIDFKSLMSNDEDDDEIFEEDNENSIHVEPS